MNRRPSWLAAVGWNLALVVACAVTLYPVLWVIKMALTPSQAFDLSPSPIPNTFSLSNFHDLVMATDMAGRWLFGHWLFNSVVVAGATTLLSLALATTAAYAFSRFVFPGRRIGMTLFLVTQMFPGVVMAIPLYLLLDAMNLLDSMVGLTLVYSTTAIPFCVWMMKGYFDTIPKDLEEAAVMDGAGRWTMFFRIILPLARPAIVVTALFSFMTAWNEFILAATFLSDETAFTLPVALQRYVGDYSTEWGHFAAGAIIVSTPVMALFFALQRHLIGGLTAGGVKG
ncbi:MAG TPA: sugar ABC transporter permease [Myxococcota bacterium]|nr:sugar ABC transporter permease [Myxococcota bacterium]HOA13058.1 sugar ABC transporter permease [Myxococcota bacterium]HOC98719.1 sugar ABC transporter permease [Myxococcota bacterium]HOH76084.1 sugar ABC transporter permease [Myxococcota bacterium]HPV04310.1 sugar ABC transporter permease [Myxococcota bacterium]